MSSGADVPPGGRSVPHRNPDDNIDEEIILEIVEDESSLRQPPKVMIRKKSSSQDRNAVSSGKHQASTKRSGNRRPSPSVFPYKLIGGVTLCLVAIGFTVWWMLPNSDVEPSASSPQSASPAETIQSSPMAPGLIDSNQQTLTQSPAEFPAGQSGILTPVPELTPEQYQLAKLAERKVLEAERLQRIVAKADAHEKLMQAEAQQSELSRLETIKPQVEATFLPALGSDPISSASNATGPGQVAASGRVPVLENEEDLDASVLASSEGGEATGNGPSEKQRELLLADIERALSLIEEDRIEDLILDFYPVELIRAIRKGKGIDGSAADLRQKKRVLQHLKSRFEACRTGTIRGDDMEVDILSGSTADSAPPPESVPGLLNTAILVGYGSHFSTAIDSALADLQAGKFETFLEKMLPIPEVNRLRKDDTLSLAAQQFESQPELLQSMVVDLSAIQKLNLPGDGDLVRFLLNSQIPNEVGGTREIRFQKVAGSWRFFDQSSEIQARIQSPASQEKSSSARRDKPLLKFERIGEHWRLTSLP